MRATVSPHLVRNRRHAEEGCAETHFVETLVTISGDARDLRKLRAATCSGHRVRIDAAARIAWHADGHADPIVPFENEGGTHIQLFLIDLPPGEVSGEVVIEDAHGAWSIPTFNVPARGDGEPIDSVLVKDGPGRWFVEVTAREPFEAITQTTEFGAAREDVTHYPDGFHRLRVGPGYCESWGLALSSMDIEGGVEHKHMMFGKFGVGSGRHLMDRGTVYAPKVVQPFAYRALVARVAPDGRPGGADACWDGFDEVEVWAEPHEVGAARAAMRGCPVPWRLTTYGRSGTPLGIEADVVLATPGEEPQDRPFSYMLFDDAGAEGFAARMRKAVVSAKGLADGNRLLDGSWFAAEEGKIDRNVKSHGVAFSLPDALVGIARGSVVDAKRRVFESSACRGCAWMTRCDGILPYPYSGTLVPEGECELKATFGAA